MEQFAKLQVTLSEEFTKLMKDIVEGLTSEIETALHFNSKKTRKIMKECLEKTVGKLTN